MISKYVWFIALLLLGNVSAQSGECLPTDSCELCCTTYCDKEGNSVSSSSCSGNICKCGCGLLGSSPSVSGLIECQCFSSQVVADVKGKGPVTMDNLQVGDQVMTSKGYETLYAIDHRHPTKMTNFIQIYHSGADKPLELTAQHMMFLHEKAEPVPASSVNVGDNLSSPNGPQEVTKIDSVSRPGLFNPLTSDGTIIVNNVIASTYSAIFSNNEWIEVGGYKVMSQQDFFNRLLKPVEFVCTKVSLGFCQTSNEKIAASEFGHNMLNYMMQQGRIEQTILMSLVMIAAFAFDFIFSQSGLALAIVGFAVYYAKNKHYKQKIA